MIKIRRRLTDIEKELLLQLQNQRRAKYGLPALKTIKIENLIHMPIKEKDIPLKKETDGGMYQ